MEAVEVAGVRVVFGEVSEVWVEENFEILKRRCMMIKEMNKKVKKLNIWDIALTKLATATGVLFVITIWPAAMTWVHSVNPWWFLVAFVVFAIKPMYKFYTK